MNNFRNEFYQNQETDKKKFRHAYVLKPSFNFSPLKQYCEKIIYATEGYATELEEIRKELEISLADFDDELDVLVPVGAAWSNLVAGMIIQRMIAAKGDRRPSIALGIFSDGDYNFWRFPLDGVTETYEIIQ